MSSRSFGPVLLRLALGAMWLSHAMLKLVVYTLPGTVAFFESKGLVSPVVVRFTAEARA